MSKSEYNFEEELERISKITMSNGANKARVEPSAAMRNMARSVREMFIAYMDEGFDRSEAIHLASVPIREAVQDGIRRNDEEGGRG